ncbi:MAG: tetratricopeptide repeat protein, partial [Acidobacteria bacterium]|nr:tetratricopeptide repeat protein [Acidobacteriota bacterium]
GQHDKALTDRQRAAELDPANPEVYIARGGSYHLLGQHDQGFADRSKAIELNPTLHSAWSARGNAYFLLDRYGDAVKDLQQAVKLVPGDQESKKLIERAEVKLTETKPAAVTEAPDLSATSALVAPNIFDLRNRNSAAPEPVPVPVAEPPKAEPVPVEAPKPAPPPPPPPKPAPKPAGIPAVAASPEDHHKQARALIASGDFAGALPHFDRAIQANPRHALAYNGRGYAHMKLGNNKQALADFTEAIRLNPSYANAYRNRAAVRHLMGDTAGAASDKAKEAGTPTL